MKLQHKAFRVAALLALVLGVVASAQAGEPTEQLRASIDRLYQTLQPSDASAKNPVQTNEILDGMFDWRQMAEASLQGQWQKRSPEEQQEFIRLFSGLFRRAYVSQMHMVDASGFQYLGETVDGSRATVKTMLRTKRDSGIDVDYELRLDDARHWRVADVRVERISLVENYRTQFGAIIARSSYEALAKKLRDIVK
jgi:phospholipid transport system substrate-binding protein